MRAKTTHVIPRGDRWAVRREGSGQGRRGDVYATQEAAIRAARALTQRERSSQLVIHGRDGSIRSEEVHGLPPVQSPPLKGNLGTKAIERAVSTVIRERLASD